MIARPQDLPVVVSQFAVPLSQLPGIVALYSLVRSRSGADSSNSFRLQWDGVCPTARIPLEYRSVE